MLRNRKNGHLGLLVWVACVLGCADEEAISPDAGRDASAMDAADVGDTGNGEPGRDTGADLAALPGPFDNRITCGSVRCDGALLQPAIEIPACCTVAGACGLDLRPAARLWPVPEICVAPGAPGFASDLCPDEVAPSGLGMTLQGCCRADRTCGVFVRFGGLDLGCVQSATYVPDAGAPVSCDVDAGAPPG